jgi:hypothetical protein
MAFPLLNKEGKTIAALNVTMGAGKKNVRSIKYLIKRLTQKSEKISRLLGFEGIYIQTVTDYPNK